MSLILVYINSSEISNIHIAEICILDMGGIICGENNMLCKIDCGFHIMTSRWKTRSKKNCLFVWLLYVLVYVFMAYVPQTFMWSFCSFNNVLTDCFWNVEDLFFLSWQMFSTNPFHFGCTAKYSFSTCNNVFGRQAFIKASICDRH